ncbi:cobD/Cbib family protein, partial [Vibrio parahaemolyticus V-223/04]
QLGCCVLSAISSSFR